MDLASDCRVLSRVRVMLDHNGQFSVDVTPLEPNPNIAIVAIYPQRINSQDRFFLHKTTHRDLYDQARAQALSEGCFEMLFVNQDGDITEGTISNVFVERQDRLLTPPIRCGLLPGILRESLLKTGRAVEPGRSAGGRSDRHRQFSAWSDSRPTQI